MFGPSDSESTAIPFSSTDYYFPEMGQPLYRRFLSFQELISPERLPTIKRATNRLEKDLSEAGKRTVNIDPGYLSDVNVIIATSKNYYHRVPLQQGIYAHLEYVIRHRQPTPLEWTYPDFTSDAYIAFFKRLLELFRSTKRVPRD